MKLTRNQLLSGIMIVQKYKTGATFIDIDTLEGFEELLLAYIKDNLGLIVEYSNHIDINDYIIDDTLIIPREYANRPFEVICRQNILSISEFRVRKLLTDYMTMSDIVSSNKLEKESESYGKKLKYSEC